jgi:hypothetical protein
MVGSNPGNANFRRIGVASAPVIHTIQEQATLTGAFRTTRRRWWCSSLHRRRRATTSAHASTETASVVQTSAQGDVPAVFTAVPSSESKRLQIKQSPSAPTNN